MADATNFETDQFLTLLTDALRTGPGSPEWHEAVTRLRAAGAGAEMDEYRLLVRAREDLESGKEFRSVRAGAGFTRKLMGAIAAEGNKTTSGVSSATIIAVAAGTVIVAVVIVVAALLMRQDPPAPGKPAELEQLANSTFPTAVVSSDFRTGIGADWQPIGTLPVVADNGLRPRPADGQPGKDLRGGVVTVNAIAATEQRAVNAEIRLDRPGDNVSLQLFVTSDRTFDPASLTTPNEFVCWLKGSQVSVLDAGGKLQRQGEKLPQTRGEPTVTRLSVRFGKEYAIVEGDGKQLFAGKHGLAADKVRYVGVRFHLQGTDRAGAISVQSVQLFKP